MICNFTQIVFLKTIIDIKFKIKIINLIYFVLDNYEKVNIIGIKN